MEGNNAPLLLTREYGDEPSDILLRSRELLALLALIPATITPERLTLVSTLYILLPPLLPSLMREQSSVSVSVLPHRSRGDADPVEGGRLMSNVISEGDGAGRAMAWPRNMCALPVEL